MKTIKLSVQEFATPPRTGSLSSSGGGGLGLMRGIELHLMVQKKRKLHDSNYQAEKKLFHAFSCGDWEFAVEGRMDGFVSGIIPRIEEIKTTVNLPELHRALSLDPYGHPYGLQLLSYGYIYWIQTQTIPELSFHLMSTRDQRTIDLSITLEITRYESWLNQRLEELKSEAEKAEARVKRRKRLVQKLTFPFEQPRKGQLELVQCLETTFKEGKNLLLQAPTGLGKTIGVLYPSLKEALNRGQKVIYVTPKNSQQQVAEEALEKIREQGCKVKSLTLTAKSKICMKDNPLCDPQYCEYAKDYYDKLTEHSLHEQMAKKRSLSARTMKKLAEEYKVCPFELQFEAIEEVDTVIGDYNHVFGERSSLGKLSLFDHTQTGKPNLVIDEVHNLPARAMALHSPSLSVIDLEELKEGSSFSREFRELLVDCQALIQKHQGPKRLVNLDPQLFKTINEKLRGLIAMNFAEIPNAFQAQVLKFTFLWSQFSETLDFMEESRDGSFFAGYYPDINGGTLKITCCDASALIKIKYANYQHIIAFSATVKPFDFYSRLCGLDDERLRVEEFFSPYLKEQRKILLIPQISTKFSEREKNYSKVAETISKITSLKVGNYLAFFPSFDFMERTLTLLKLDGGFSVIKQKRNMKRSEVDETLEVLRSGLKPILLCGVQGGMFSEGIDYPGQMAIGAFIIGPALPNFDFEREKMKEYYQKTYSQGFEFAYSFPAMAKVVQAAGRVIRSESDHGIIVLMDNRFLSPDYYQTLPQDWFHLTPQELVSSGILQELRSFWSTTPY